MYQYKITATITKAGGSPIEWTYYSKTILTQEQCEKQLSVAKAAGITEGCTVIMSNFQCVQMHTNDAIVKA